MNSNQNGNNVNSNSYAFEEAENWRELLPDQLPPALGSFEFTTESISQLSDYDLDLTYRSIGRESDHHQNQDFFSLPSSFISMSNSVEDVRKEVKQQYLITPTAAVNLKAPVVPFYIGFLQFSLKMSLPDLVVRVQNCLDQIIELDYSFIDTYCKWDIVYLRGSSFCHFEISLFDEKLNSEKYLLEGNRLSGDSLAFRLIFHQIKETLTTPKFRQMVSPISPYLQALPVPSATATAVPQPQPPKFPSRSVNISSGIPNLTSSSRSGNSIEEDELIRENLLPILSMLEPSTPIDVQLEGIRILCDVTMSIDLHRLLVECNCVEKLINLITLKATQSAATTTAECESAESENFINEEARCHQSALYALANMSTFRPCQNILVSSDPFLFYLMNHIKNGSHTTAEMRRECARTLANLCVGLAPKIVRNLGLPATMRWVETVDSLSDERLKIHATRAKMYIENCF